jgi:hypothetical protein
MDLPDEAHRIAEALLPGLLPTAALREVAGDRGRYDRAMAALRGTCWSPPTECAPRGAVGRPRSST